MPLKTQKKLEDAEQKPSSSAARLTRLSAHKTTSKFVSEPAIVAVRPIKLTRSERTAQLREGLLHSAAIVVGELGYQDASIARITQLAGVAQGTFYRYFESRQQLFDVLLPHAGKELMRYIGDRLHGAKNFVDAEERGIRALFDYLTENPGFYRVLNEAEFAAPSAHKEHFKELVEHYTRSLRRSVRDGSLKSYSSIQLEAVAYALVGARSYIYLTYVKYFGLATPPEAVIKTYLSMITDGLGSGKRGTQQKSK